ncbi:hypothetical protein GCM10007420_03240 [Glycocaulis albus]|jgi:hypothetical protein|uniref:Uncharacterized protein n=1 Tax=Glycocaulis albus TaxID=1382801 RepID=A0ABQ1XEL4_9PROT|nr:hypothetical protein [Glycocaulis albus]GGG91322.1 hypothetical protein GCM10007420_03240 [Glycocaulis albus]
MSGALRKVRGPDLIWLIAGFSVWGAGFSVLYGLHAVGCRAGWEEAGIAGLSANRIMLLAVYLGHGVLGAALWFPLNRIAGRWEGASADTVRRVAVIVTLAAVISTLWTGAPVLFLEACV